ncbi:NAD-dependent epimerase/dehydratase family protein [Jiulongibacter sediminis]|uniref:NAD-dependent epimerase/dehydratase domain-containing protein n=1 Tax=Jiulongibacter sediminis TaxID=1605367 RepID=A0A0P7C009_9BACT|nr:NAD-dependent epimerase/dehydratase family protein [Jiulongibacter sediminis]KPM47271.1 hypothetical protein AFM12_15860 [Jiulongibacter sediminis]TBX22829.1 hypothetical protein TK44_15870 [Jiulongibacter sediminis]
MSAKLKVFITGLSSSLLQKVADFLSEDQYEIIGLTRKDLPPQVKNVKWVKGQLENPASYSQSLAGVSFVIHGAALTHTTKEEDYYKVNFEGTKLLVNEALKYGVKQFVLISSRAAVEGSGGYGESKLAAEKYVQKSFKNWIVFKPGEIFGGIKSEGIESLIDDAIQKKFVVYPGGKSQMYPVSLNDTARVIYEWTFEKRCFGEIITVNGPDGFTYQELIRKIASYTGQKPILLPIPKVTMYLIKAALKLLGLRLGIVPDQVDRFYAPKPVQYLDFPFEKIDAYLLQKIETAVK